MQIEDLTEAEITQKINQILPVIGKATPQDFVNIVTFLAQNGTNFEDNLKLIDEYYKLIEDESSRLQLERILYRSFLKKYETEHCFNEFFNLIQKHCSRMPVENSRKDRQSSIWFYVDAPVFLAHTNAMFKLLQGRDMNSVRVFIASTTFNSEFKKKCNDINVNFKVLSGKNDLERYRNLVSLSGDALAVCWNGPPLHLNYISKHLKNVIYWSHRFHPRFDGVSLCISGDPTLKKNSVRFGKNWSYFYSGFDIKNLGQSINWESRSSHFGSFCRETLIDNEQHWINVSTLLNRHKKLTYHYAGRKEIHNKYCSLFSIDNERINWLGWMKKPEKEILKMSFILDGPILGHGLMGVEALSGRVPIIAPKDGAGFFHNFSETVQFDGTEKQLLDKAFGLKFSSLNELEIISEQLLQQDYNAQVGEILYTKICEKEMASANFDTFMEIVESVNA